MMLLEVAMLILVCDASTEGVEIEVIGCGQLGKLRARHPTMPGVL